MADPTGMLQVFKDYLDLILAEGRQPSNEDVDHFISEFLKSGRPGFLFKRTYLKSAESRDRETKEPLYDKSKKSYSEIVDEIKPILESRVVEAYGKIDDRFGPYKFTTTPMTVDQYADFYAGETNKEEFDKLTGSDRRNHPAYQKAVKEVNKLKYRIKEYMRLVLPFTARVTMYHELAAVSFSTTSGPFDTIQRNDNTGAPFIIDSEEKLNKFLDSKTLDGFPAADHEGLRSLFWSPTESGNNIKMGIIDIDNPAKLPEKELIRYVKKIYRRVAFDLEHPAIIMFTGESFQIWIGLGNESIITTREMKDYLKTVLSDFGSFKAAEAVKLSVPFIDLDVNGPRQLVRTFFSLHYPPSTTTQKPYTGLAAIPVPYGHLDKFNRMIDAHPESVLVNFDTYSSMVATFYDQVQIGQDYESPGEIEVQPSCSRLENKVPNHPALNAIYKESDLNIVEYRNVGAVLEGEEKVYAHPVARGVLAVLVYDPKGDMAPPGMSAKRLVRKKVVTQTPHSYYILSNGVVIYDDYICRDFERVCIAKKIRQAVLVGRVSLFDSFGNEEASQETMNQLIRSEGILPSKARIMKFTINRSPIVGGQPVPINIMGDQIKEFASKRTIPSPYFEFEAPVGMKLKNKYMDLVRAKMSGSLMVEGEEKYLIKSTRTLTATIVAMDITGKAYAAGNDMPPVIVAVANKTSKYGTEYFMVAKAQIALKQSDRLSLRMMVEGEDKKNVIPAPRGPYKDQIVYTEPSVVVEVSYDDVTPQTFITQSFAFTTKGDFRPTPKDKAINYLINAKVIGIRQDLDHRRPNHISYRQEELLQLSARPTTSDFELKAIPNPGSKIPEFIRRNPSSFYGVPQTLEVYIGGYPKQEINTLPDGTKVVTESVAGGRRVQLPLITPAKGRYLGEKIPGELEKAYDRWYKGEPGHQAFVDTASLVTGDSPHYRITNLGFEYNTAQDDRYGMGQEGNSVISMGGRVSKKENFLETMETKHLEGNKRQAFEDSKVFQSTFQEVPGDPESELADRRHYDLGYRAAYDQADANLSKALRETKLEGAVEDEAVDLIMSNPRPMKDDLWQLRVDLYIEEFNKWDSLPEPKEEWELYAAGIFLPWELPILEKDRNMLSAKEQFDLTEEEASQIDLNYVASPSSDMFDLILSDLYEVPDDDAAAQEYNF